MAEIKYEFSGPYQDRVIASIMRDPDFLKEYRDAIRPSFFEREEHQTISTVILRLFDRHSGRPSRDVLVEELAVHGKQLGWESSDVSRFVNEVDRLIDLDLSDADIGVVKERAVQFGQHQALKDAILQCADMIEQNEREPGSLDLGGMMPIIQKAVMIGNSRNTGIDVLDNVSHLHRILELDGISDPRYRIPSGFTRLDKYLEGGLGAGELGLVMAQSGRGKSMLLTNFAAHAVRAKKKVIYFTLELKPYEVAARILAQLFRCTIAEVKDGDPKYVTAAQTMGKRWMKESELGIRAHLQTVFFKPSHATSLNLRSSISNIEMIYGWKPDLIIVDYIDEMRGLVIDPRKGEDSYHTYGNIASELIDISVDYRCPLWSAAQIKREAYDKEVGLHHMGRSMQKIDKADVVLAVSQSKDEYALNQMRLVVLKNRRGSNVLPIRCKVDFSKAEFKELPWKDNTKESENGTSGNSRGSTAK